MERITTFAARLRELLSVRNLTQAELSRMTGIDKGRLSHYLRGDYEAKQDGVYDIAKAANVEEAWLMGYDVPMDRKPRPSLDNSIFDIPGIIPLPKTYNVPLLGEIACGNPILAEQNIIDQVPVPEHIKGADFALTCKGDSMINARIFDGDIVYIHQQPEVENGQIAAVLIGNEATLKRIRRFENKIVLYPENPDYEPLIFTGEEMADVKIIGKAIAFFSAVR